MMKKVCFVLLMLCLAFQSQAQVFPGVLAQSINSVLFMSTTDRSIVNTTAETSAFASGVGSRIIPANTLKAGTNIIIRGGGLYSVPTLTIGNFTVKVYVGSTIVTSSVVSTLVGGVTNGGFEFESVLAIRSSGVSGVVQPLGGSNFATTAGSRLFYDLLNSGVSSTIDTTIPQAIDVTAQWQTASSSRSVTITGASVSLQQ